MCAGQRGLAAAAGPGLLARGDGEQRAAGAAERLDLEAELVEQAAERFGAVLDGGYAERPDAGAIVGEAVRGSVAALIYQEIRRRGPERLYEVAGVASFVALAPFVGADRACALANEGWRPAPAQA